MSSDPLANGLRRVRLRFIESIRDSLPRIIHLRTQVLEEAQTGDAPREIGQICHKIAGTAATLGFPKLGANAVRIDNFLISNVDNQLDPGPYLLMEIDQLVLEINAILSNHDAL